MSGDFWIRPCAAEGLKSYRYRGRFGWVMIGARDNEDALREAARSIVGEPDISLLQVWNGVGYAMIEKEV